MGKKQRRARVSDAPEDPPTRAAASTKGASLGRPSALLDTRVISCGDNLKRLARSHDRCVDLIYVDPPFSSTRNYEAVQGGTKERQA